MWNVIDGLSFQDDEWSGPWSTDRYLRSPRHMKIFRSWRKRISLLHGNYAPVKKIKRQKTYQALLFILLPSIVPIHSWSTTAVPWKQRMRADQNSHLSAGRMAEPGQCYGHVGSSKTLRQSVALGAPTPSFRCRSRDSPVYAPGNSREMWMDLSSVAEKW